MYNNKEKALILLSQEMSIKKRMERYNSAQNPEELFDDLALADIMIDQMQLNNIQAVTVLSENYPKQLLDLYDPPIVLYCRGDISILSNEYLCAVVGTRKPTRYGKDVVSKFIKQFVASSVVVVSGLARGIDSAAHRECLSGGGKTIAVVATGLDVVYPSENVDLAHEIASSGLIVSEYPLGTKPLAYRFPERNRIISGLSKAVLIPEAGLNSGSLITANCAIEQGRELFVVPGSIFSSQSNGCNLKLKELQAAIATTPEDILGSVGISDERKSQLAVQLTIEEQKIVDMLAEEEVHFTQLLEESKLSVGELSALLTQMEVYGIIRRLAGNFYELIPS